MGPLRRWRSPARRYLASPSAPPRPPPASAAPRARPCRSPPPRRRAPTRSTITASNNDVEPQTDVCTLTVTVTPIRTIGEVQGSVGDAADGLTHRSPFAPPAGNAAGQQVFVRGVVTQLGRFPTATGGQNWGFWLQSRVGDEDGDPNSSDGVFVFIGGFQTVLRLDGGPAYQPVVGDEILLRGNVTEFFFLTELGGPRLVEVTDTGVDVTDPDEIDDHRGEPAGQPGRREPLLGAPRGHALPPGCRRARRGRAGRLPIDQGRGAVGHPRRPRHQPASGSVPADRVPRPASAG